VNPPPIEALGHRLGSGLMVGGLVGAEDGDEAEDGIVGEDCGVEDGHRSCAPHAIGGVHLHSLLAAPQRCDHNSARNIVSMVGYVC
jgi:hypothetical protein